MNEEQPLAYHLAVRSAFRTYKRGDMITDPATVQAVLGSEDAVHVVKVAAPDPAPTPVVAPATNKAAVGPAPAQEAQPFVSHPETVVHTAPEQKA
jgi:hypothetical protein